jgi:hypothetical protein
MHHGPQMGWMHRMAPMPMMVRKAAAQRMLMLQIIYLPDFSKPYVAKFNNPFSHHKNSILLANGWELMGINVKGHLKEPPPIRAIDALPSGGPPGGLMRPGHPMMGPGGLAFSPMGGRKPGMMGGLHHGHMGPMHGHGMMHGMRRGMMHRPAMLINRWHHMMMARRAAMMMGLTPGLYQFIYSPKTGALIGLRRVRILPGMAPFGPPMMMMHHPMWHHQGAWGYGKKWMHPHSAAPTAKKPASTNP